MTRSRTVHRQRQLRPSNPGRLIAGFPPIPEVVLALAQATLFLKLILMLLIFDPAAYDAFALPKIAASRATTYLLLAFVLVLGVWRGASFWRWSPLYVPLAAYVAANAIAAIFAVDPILALYGAPTRYEGLASVLDHAVTLVAAVMLIRTLRDLGRLLIAFFATAIPIFVYALVQRLGFDPVVWADPTVQRASATFGNAGPMGGYFAIVGASSVALLMWEWDRLPGRGRFGAIAVTVLAISGLILSGTRASVIGLAGGIVAAASLLAWVRREPSGAKWASMKVLVLAGIVVSVAALPVAVSRVSDRSFVSLVGIDDVRLVLWDTALGVVRDRPLLGAGPDNFAAVFAARRPERSLELSLPSESSTHNWILHASVSAGVLGLAALLAILGVAVSLVAHVVRSGRGAAAIAFAAVAAYLGQGLFTISHPAVEVVFWIALGAIGSMAAGAVEKEEALQPREYVPLRQLVGSVLVLGIALLLAATAGRSVAASRAFNLALGADAAARHDLAIAAAKEAVSLDPNRAAYWSILGKAHSDVGDRQRALEAFERAASLAPYRSGYWRNVAVTRWQLAAGRPDQLTKAFEAAERAVSAEPLDSDAHDLLARIALDRGDAQRAATEALRALELQPQRLSFYDTLSVAHARLRNWREAEETIARGLSVGESPQLRLTLAKIYLATNRLVLAREQLERVLSSDPTNSEALELLRLAPR